MLLVLQIAAGIVLGFLILHSLPRILHVLRKLWRIGLIFAVLAAVIVLVIVLGTTMEGHAQAVWESLGIIAMVVVLMAAIQYTARGLGYLYLWQRARVATSRRWTHFLLMLGVHPSWHTTNRSRAEIASKVGDALFRGLWLFLGLYLLVSFLILLGVAMAFKATHVFDASSRPWVVVLWVVAAFLPGALVFLWVSRQRRLHVPPGTAL